MDFVLFDLRTQLDAVNAYTQGWDRQAILDWLGLFGEVIGPLYLEGFDGIFGFGSPCGLRTGFYFNDAGQIWIPGRKGWPD